MLLIILISDCYNSRLNIGIKNNNKNIKNISSLIYISQSFHFISDILTGLLPTL